MTEETILETICSSPEFSRNIAGIHEIPPREGVYADLPSDLDPRLRAACLRRGLERLYSHQAEAWDQARAGKNCVVVTPTASGKTLCYNLPVLQKLIEDPAARALYLFPTKALSQDQQSELNGFLGHESVEQSALLSAQQQMIEPLPLRVSIYDGDTPQSVRNSAREQARIIISNPDMMHTGILPNHPRWIRFFSRLSYVVIDEMHIYRGVFGSHVANVIRRIRRIASFYGSDPVFILCSATIGNPAELAGELIGAPVHLVDKNGAPSGAKSVVLYNPPVIDPVQGIRRGVTNESTRWALSLLRGGIKTILFAHSRVRTEITASYINASVASVHTNNQGIRVVPYRGGLLPLERRAIEKGLRNGEIQGVVSTNALELGIDIGGLSAAVVAGFPGSFASFWQQAGRAGRRQRRSIAVFVASASPLDQYIISHPEYFFRRPGETARIDPDNPYILTDHVKCAAFELPFREEPPDLFFPPEALSDILGMLEEAGTLRHTGGRWHWSDRSYPSESVSLRSATADNVVIVDTTGGRNTVIGEMDRPSARELLFPNAVYIHLGRQYMVTELDLPNRTARVEESSVNYFTDAVVKTDIRVLSEDEEPVPGLVIGDLLIRTQVSKFKKIRFRSHENIGFGEIALDAEEHETRGLLYRFDQSVLLALAGDDEAAEQDIVSSAAYLLRSVTPFFLLCDRRDIGISPRIRDPLYGGPALYFYDTVPGGTGLSEALALCLGSVFATASEHAAACPCSDGCPSCIGVDHSAEGVKASTVAFLSTLASALATAETSNPS